MWCDTHIYYHSASLLLNSSLSCVSVVQCGQAPTALYVFPGTFSCDALGLEGGAKTAVTRTGTIAGQTYPAGSSAQSKVGTHCCQGGQATMVDIGEGGLSLP